MRGLCAWTWMGILGCGAAPPPTPPSPAPEPVVSSAPADEEVAPELSTRERGKAFVQQLADGELELARASFDDTMKEGVSAEALGGIWTSLRGKLGPFVAIEDAIEQTDGDYAIAIVTTKFEKARIGLRVVFDSQARVAGLFIVDPPRSDADRPQHPKPPFPYATREVTFESSHDRATFGGTLTLPAGDGPHPAALLITGSGSQDRDETIFGHKPFLVLADRLTRNGFAVLRVDDRGVGASTGNPNDATIQVHVEDVASGFSFLREQPEVDADRVGLIGHSEGGIIAPFVAADHDVAFIVSLAGTGLPGTEISPMQIGELLRADGQLSEDAIASAVATQRTIVEAVAAGQSDDELARVMKKALHDANALLPADRQLSDAELDVQVAQELASVTSPWFKSFLTTDPRDGWSKVRCPVLALVGDLDRQVPAKANLEAIAEALAQGGNRDVTTEALVGLNHLFQPATTGAVSEYGEIQTTFDEATLDRITAWMVTVSRTP